jgi:hypothetical protein
VKNQNVNKIKSGTSNKTARVVGALFLIAMAASLFGGTLIESILSAPDYFGAASENRSQLLIGIFLELINAISVVCIGALMFSLLKGQNENMARIYLSARVIEAVLCVAAVIMPLALIKVNAGALATLDLQAAGALLIAARAGIMDALVLVFFCLGAALFYFLLYKSRLIPRLISVWGMIAVVLVFAVNIMGLFSTTDINLAIKMSFALPIILNEVFLGIWLMVKGFNPKNNIL